MAPSLLSTMVWPGILRPVPHTWGLEVSVLWKAASARKRVARAERSRSKISSEPFLSLNLAYKRFAKLD